MDRIGGKMLLVIWLSVLGWAAALFEDQAGTFDWYQQRVGFVSSAVFHPTKPRVCVATAQNILGCLHLRDGSIAWRKLLGSGRGESASAIVQPQAVVAASAGFLQFYDLEGNLKWQRRSPIDSVKPVLLQLPYGLEGGAGKVLVMQGDTVQVLAGADGSEVAKLTGLSALYKSNVVALASETATAVLAYQPGAEHATLMEIKESGSAVVREQTYESPMALSHVAAASTNSFAVVSADSTAVCLALLNGEAAFKCQALSEMAPGLVGLRRSTLTRTSSGYIVASAEPGNPGAALLAVGPGGSLTALREFPSALGVSTELATDQDRVIAVVEALDGGGLRLVVASSRNGELLHEEAFPAVPSSGRVVGEAPAEAAASVALGWFRKKDKSIGFRAMVTLSSGVTAMLQQGVIVWSRDESLAAVRETLFVDLPAKGVNGTVLAAQNIDISTRLRYQLLGAKIQLKINRPDEAAEYLQLRSRLSDRNVPVRDVNGFRKLLLALTTTGKLAALHSGDGRVLWSRAFGADSAPTRLLPWRVYHDIQHAPEVLLLRETQPEPYALVLNAHTGEQLLHMQLPYGVQQVVPLQTPLHEGSAFQSLYLLIGQSEALDRRVQFLPDTAASRAHFTNSQRLPRLVMHGEQPNAMKGYQVSVLQGSAGSDVSVSLIWQLVFPDSILATAARDPTEPVQSSVKVLSDRTIKYKYLNPNLLFVATGQPAGASTSANDVAGLSPEVTAYLVDTVTGRVLHRQSHPGALGPVTAVLTENAVLYFYRDHESGRHVACSMELFDATGREFSVLDYLFNPNSTQPVSSFSPSPVEVLTQSFFSRIVPTAATVTRTEQGITSKQLLLVTNTDQVFALDRRWIDPRRPKKQKLSQEEMEEGLVPYQDTLPLSPLSFATLDKQVLGIRGVAVEATRLESTCLLFVHGVDMFFTRLAPAKGFDSLEDDFNYGLLLTALAGLAAGSFVMRYMAKQAALREKWK